MRPFGTTAENITEIIHIYRLLRIQHTAADMVVSNVVRADGHDPYTPSIRADDPNVIAVLVSCVFALLLN